MLVNNIGRWNMYKKDKRNFESQKIQESIEKQTNACKIVAKIIQKQIDRYEWLNKLIVKT